MPLSSRVYFTVVLKINTNNLKILIIAPFQPPDFDNLDINNDKTNLDKWQLEKGGI